MIRKILIAAVALVALMAAPAAAQYGGLTVNPGSVRPGGNADYNFARVPKWPRSDAAVFLTAFSLTVVVDLTIAVEIGMDSLPKD